MNKDQNNSCCKKISIFILIMLLDITPIYWMFISHMDSSMSLGIIYIIFIVVIFNILLGLVFNIFNIKYYYWFYYNILISPIIIIIGLYWVVNYYAERDLQGGIVYFEKDIYSIYFDNKENVYKIYNDSLNKNIIKGKFKILEKGKIELGDDIFIISDSINNFPKKGVKLRMNSFYEGKEWGK